MFIAIYQITFKLFTKYNIEICPYETSLSESIRAKFHPLKNIDTLVLSLKRGNNCRVDYFRKSHLASLIAILTRNKTYLSVSWYKMDSQGSSRRSSACSSASTSSGWEGVDTFGLEDEQVRNEYHDIHVEPVVSV